jgi:outer membrane autotransporter protein
MASGVFSPVLSVAWMHEFGDTAQEVNMSFAGAPKGANFKVVGSEVARDSAVVDAGAKFMVSDSFDLGLFYNGQFNADYTSNGVTATLGYRF